MKAKKKIFEFLTLFVMTIGTVVGAGIYLKNYEVLEQTRNPIIAILIWVIVGIVCLFAMVAFFEISSATKKSGNGTLGNWLKLFVNRKVASFLSVLYVVMYVPAYNALFIGMFIYFLLQVIGVELTWQIMLTIYLILGVVLMFAFHFLNALSFKTAKGIQLFGTFFKFIPLVIAFIAGFILISRDPSGAMFNNGEPNLVEGGNGITWSTSNWNPALFFRGFGGVLLAFDGFIYLANQQKTFQHKEVVPQGIFMGMLFAAIFYVLMAISLFLGSPDGSVVALFEKMFGGNQRIASFISNFLLMIICLLNINLFVMIGVGNIQSDLDAKLLYAGARAGKVSPFKSATVQAIVSSLVYIVFILVGFFATDVSAIIATGPTAFEPVKYINIMSSIAGVISFSVIDLLIIAALVNRKTKKVAVEPVKHMFWTGIIATIFITVFVISGIYTFLDPKIGDYSEQAWVNSSGFYFLILFISLVGLSTIAFFIQESLFKRHPFAGGFDGYLTGVDDHPWTFNFNWKENYFQRQKEKGTANKVKSKGNRKTKVKA